METRRTSKRSHEQLTELNPLPPAPTVDHSSQNQGPEAMEERLLDTQMCEQVAILERTPLHKLAEVLPQVLSRIRELAENNNNVLHQGSVLSRLSFSTSTVEKLQELKKLARCTSTWQWLNNESDHRAFISGSRVTYWRTLCTVETAIFVIENADFKELLQTGNFVLTSDKIVSALKQKGLWQLAVPVLSERHN